jgi:hypothetical protein
MKKEYWIDMTLNVDRPYAKTAYLNLQDAEEKSSTYTIKVINAEYVDKLENDLEKLRMQLAACATAALANTHESKKLARVERSSPYFSSAYEIVCETVDREIAYREQLEALKK